jgi:hypothetical protein
MLQLKRFVALDFAAQTVSKSLGENICERDLIEFARDGHLKISLSFDENFSAKKYERAIFPLKACKNVSVLSAERFFIYRNIPSAIGFYNHAIQPLFEQNNREDIFELWPEDGSNWYEICALFKKEKPDSQRLISEQLEGIDWVLKPQRCVELLEYLNSDLPDFLSVRESPALLESTEEKWIYNEFDVHRCEPGVYTVLSEVNGKCLFKNAPFSSHNILKMRRFLLIDSKGKLLEPMRWNGKYNGAAMVENFDAGDISDQAFDVVIQSEHLAKFLESVQPKTKVLTTPTDSEDSKARILAIVGGLLHLMLEKNPTSGKSRSGYNGANMIIHALEQHFPQVRGLKKSTLEKHFAEANRIINFEPDPN